MASTEFDFDRWAALARSNPQAFEDQRRRAIENTIRDAPEHLQPRLRAMQWRLDQERHRAGSPLGACLRLHQLLLQRVHESLLPALEGRLEMPEKASSTAVTRLRPHRIP